VKEFSSGKLANLAGVNIETLRFYEKKGVISKP
jgi:DNA-binding transcriptional MerR regulator